MRQKEPHQNAITDMVNIKGILFLLLFALNISCINKLAAQVNQEKLGVGLSPSTVDVIYGNLLPSTKFTQDFNSFSGYSLFSPVQTIGLGVLFPYNYGLDDFEEISTIAYSQIIPQKIMVNDSIRSNINGFVFNFSLFGWDLLRNSKYFHLVVNGGFNTGRFKIGGNRYATQKNPFFSPSLSIQRRIYLGSVAISLRVDYAIDLSKSAWRTVDFNKNPEKISLNDFRQTGCYIYFSIGKIFPAEE